MLFITPKEVVDYSFLPRENIVSDSIRLTKIDIAQERFLRPRLGDSLYDALSSGLHTDFRDCYLKPALAFYVRYGLLEDYAVFIDENGIVLFGGNNEEGSKQGSLRREGNLDRSGSLTRNATEARDQTTTDTGSETRTGSDTGTRSETRSDTTTTDGTDKLTRTGTNSETTATDATGKNTKKDVVNENLLKDSTTDTRSHVATEPWEERTFLSTTVTNKTNTYITDTTDKGTKTAEGSSSLNDSRLTTDKRTASVTSSGTSTDENQLTIATNDNTTLDSTRTTNLTDATTQKDATLLSDSTTGSSDTSRRSYTPAPVSMIHTLQLRALSDANALMGKAIRQLAKHPEQFPEYVPRTRTIF